MSGERLPRCFLSRSVRATALLLGSTALLLVAWYCSTVSLTDDQRSLVGALVEGASLRDSHSPVIQVAIFHSQIPGSEPTEGLAEVFNSARACAWESVGPVAIASGALDQFDVVVFPGGGGGRQQAATLGEEGKRAVRDFVRAGGGYVGICGGAFLATAKYDWSLALVNARTVTGTKSVPGMGRILMGERGRGKVKMELTKAGMQVFPEVARLVEVEYAGGPILSPAGRDDLSEYVSLAIFRTEVWQYEPQQGTMIGTPAIVAGQFGNGRVIIFSPHPEMTNGLESLVVQAALAVARKDRAEVRQEGTRNYPSSVRPSVGRGRTGDVSFHTKATKRKESEKRTRLFSGHFFLDLFSGRPSGACLLGRLDSSREWFVPTPAVLLLKDGIVEEVCGEPGVADLRRVIERTRLLRRET